MFSPDTERVIPRPRIKFASLILQTLFVVLFILVLVWVIFEPDRFRQIGNVESFILYIFLAFFILTALVGLVNRWNQQRMWKIFAEEMGFQVEQKNRFTTPVIKGTYRGHPVTIKASVERQGRNQIHYTNFMVQLNNPHRSTFTIKKRRLTHLKREPTGDGEIDRKLTIKISSDRLLQQILKSHRLRQGLLELGERARTRDLFFNGKTLHYKERGQITDLEYMRAVIGYMIEMTKLIERMEQIGM